MALVESSIRRDEIAKCLKNGLNLGDVSDRSSSLERNLGRGTSCHFFFISSFFFINYIVIGNEFFRSFSLLLKIENYIESSNYQSNLEIISENVARGFARYASATK